MIKKHFLMILLVLAVSGSCLYSTETTIYTPDGRQEYIFPETTSSSGYLSDIFETLQNAKSSTYQRGLFADKYSFKKYYIEDLLASDNFYNYYAVIIETGERYIWKVISVFADGFINELRKASDYLIFKENIRIHAPLFAGSSIQIEKGEFNSGQDTYYFNNGSVLTSKNWLNIVSVIEYLNLTDIKKKEAVADLLSKAKVKIVIDDFDEIAFVEVGSKTDIADIMSFTLRTTYPIIQLYLSISEGTVNGRLEGYYQGKDWIFANSVTLGADKERWDSGIIDFTRETSKLGVKEFFDIHADETLISFFEKFCNAKDPKVRFRGENSNYDAAPDTETIQIQKDILKLYKIITL